MIAKHAAQVPGRSLIRGRSPLHRAIPLCAGALFCLAPELRAQSQVLFSVDYRGATISTLSSSTPAPIHESDILRAAFGQPNFGPLPAPELVFNGAALGLTAFPACVVQTPGQPCHIEVDALSLGNDAPFDNTLPIGAPGRARIYFSVDRFAKGRLGSGIAPNVLSEGLTGVNEAAADVFTVYPTIAGPLSPTGGTGSNIGVFDGNGLANTAGRRYRGFGLREQTQPGPFDDLDALTIAPLPTGANAAIYFSLDGAILDPLTLQVGSNSAALQGTPPSAVLRRAISGGPVQIYANPAQLGLSPLNDDLDALILTDNGDGIYQPSIVPYDWLTGTTDMLLFSLRRGSARIGTPDGLFGLPIEPGDILMPPATPGTEPRIFIPAERMGLRTSRTDGELFGDDVDALADTREPYNDCNNNGRDDAEDIAVGYSSDTNSNGIPDECEQSYTRYCYCETPKGPCGNDDAAAGCRNNTGLGGLLCGARTTSVATDDLEMSATQLPPSTIGLLFMSPTQMDIPFGDGRLCAGPTVYRLTIAPADILGNASLGPGFVALSNAIGGAAVITPGSTWNFQFWYRDAAAYCTSATYNLTNGLSVLFTP